MFEENKYLCEIFGEIVQEVIDKKRISEGSKPRTMQLKQYLNDYFEPEEEVLKNEELGLNLGICKKNDDFEPEEEELTNEELRLNLRIYKKDVYSFESEVEDLYHQTCIYSCPKAKAMSISELFSKKPNLSESQMKILDRIDFSDELNCLVCIFCIFRFFRREYDWYNIRDGDTKLVKEKMESAKILERKNIILNVLLKCVENLSIDQKLKERARKMIFNTAKYIRAYFFIEEKDDIEKIIQSLKFRLNNMIELEKHDILDKLMPDDTLPDDYQEENLKSEQLVLAKSEINNIARSFLVSILDFCKEPQFKSIVNSVEANDYSTKMKDNFDEKARKEMPPKEKKTNIFTNFMNRIFCLY